MSESLFDFFIDNILLQNNTGSFAFIFQGINLKNAYNTSVRKDKYISEGAMLYGRQ